jgi:hypothetical protein
MYFLGQEVLGGEEVETLALELIVGFLQGEGGLGEVLRFLEYG